MNNKRNPPIAVCTKCGKYSYRAESINLQCSERYKQKRCKGVVGSAMAPRDWEQCPHCNGIGCKDCQSSGYLFVRK